MPERRRALRCPAHRGPPPTQAFGLEQCGQLAEAEEEAARGDRIDGSDAWSHHSMAHTLYFQARLRECEQYMLARAHTWTDLCSFMHTHNWWHVALAQVEQGAAAARGQGLGRTLPIPPLLTLLAGVSQTTSETHAPPSPATCGA